MNPYSLILVLALAGTPESPAFDACVIMLPGVPLQPWNGLSDRILEELWTRDVTGYQVTFSGWSGYMMMGPPGSGETIGAAAELLVQGAVMPDTSGWARLLELSWRENALPCVLTYPFSPGDTPVPMRHSALLSGTPDTVVVSAPVANNVLLITGVHDPQLGGSAWRGLGLEVVPSDWGGVPLLLAFSFAGSPGDLDRMVYEAHPYDSVWAAGFGTIMAAVDSLAAPLAPVTEPTLVWVRGAGGAEFHPWTFVPSPGPPLRCPGAVTLPVAGTMAPRPWTPPPTAMRVDMPGLLSNRDDAEQTAAIIERLVARMVLVESEELVGLNGFSEEGGRVALFLENPPWASPEEALEEITAVLTPLAFTSPEAPLLSNCAVRASLRLGREVAPLSPQRAAECVARALGLLQD